MNYEIYNQSCGIYRLKFFKQNIGFLKKLLIKTDRQTDTNT